MSYSSMFEIIKQDVLHLIACNEKVVASNKSAGVYMIYVDCDFNICKPLPFWIEKSQGIGAHWSTQRNRIKKFLNGQTTSDDPLDNLVFHRLNQFFIDYYNATGCQLSTSNVRAVCLSTDVGLDSLDETEAYWTSRLKSEMTSVGHSLFVKTLRRAENKILYSKDVEETKEVIESYLLKAYKYGSVYLNDALIYNELMNCSYAKENMQMLAYYVYKKGLPFIEDDEFVNLERIAQAKSLFYSLVNRYFNVK